MTRLSYLLFFKLHSCENLWFVPAFPMKVAPNPYYMFSLHATTKQAQEALLLGAGLLWFGAHLVTLECSSSEG